MSFKTEEEAINRARELDKKKDKICPFLKSACVKIDCMLYYNSTNHISWDGKFWIVREGSCAFFHVSS